MTPVRSFCRTLLLFVMVAGLCPKIAANDTPTSLTLQSVFQAPPNQTEKTSGWNRYSPGGPPFEMPDPGVFRAPAPESDANSETENRFFKDQPLPHVPPRGYNMKNRPRRRLQPALKDAGQRLTGNRRLSYVETRNTITDRCIQVELIPTEGEPVVYLLGPGFDERIAVAPGEWTVHLESWPVGRTDEIERQEFESQRLKGGWNYALELGDR